jgi:type IV secretory pathway VirB10-like protein
MRELCVVLWFLAGSQTQSAVIPAGTQVEARLETAIKTDEASPGDSVVAVLATAIRAADRIVVPQGSRLFGQVETIQPATPEREGRVRLVFR